MSILLLLIIIDTHCIMFRFLIFIIFLVLTYANPIKCENLIIETRSGMLIFYYVEVGDGIKKV